MRLLAIILMASLAAPVTAEAVTFRYTIDDGTFDDGGTFSGFFEFNTVANLITNHELTVSGGNTALFPEFTYAGTQARSSGRFVNVLPNTQIWAFGDPSAPTELTLGFREAFGFTDLNSGVGFSLLTGPSIAETLYPSTVSRGITGGTTTASVVAAILLPAPAALLLGALGFLDTFRLWSRRRPAV